MPGVTDSAGAGDVPAENIDKLAKVWSNPRVRDQVNDATELVELATQLEPRDFARAAGHWERLADADGAEDRNETSHARRNATLVQDYNGNWVLHGRFGTLQGAGLAGIFEQFCRSEWHQDWSQARQRLGDHATETDLARTPAQRRADALDALFRAAGAAPPGARQPEPLVEVIIDLDTFTHLATTPAGTTPPANPRARCETREGGPVSATEARWLATWAQIRRVVVDSAGVVVALGRRQRLFTGSAREALTALTPECFWPGCSTPVAACQADHLTTWTHGGTTNPANGAPACGRHNRLKSNGFTTHRNPDGTWNIHRPDRTPITHPP